ncbi:MAG: hypothetical protein QOG19_1345 [Mycobacterium sp.]|nr:hypothetical protein [Mycobacterium sp.]
MQIVWSLRHGSRSIGHTIGHIGSAHELAALNAAAAERLSAGQAVLGPRRSRAARIGALPITSSKMTHLWDRLCAGYRVLGFERVKLAKPCDALRRALFIVSLIYSCAPSCRRRRPHWRHHGEGGRN